MGKLIVLSSEVMTDKSRGVWNEAVKFAWNATQNKISGFWYINVRYTCFVEVF